MSYNDTYNKNAIIVLTTGDTFTAASTVTTLGTTLDTTKFHNFMLYLDIQFNGELTSTVVDGRELQIKPRFSNDGGTTFFAYQNDFWGDLRFNDSQGNVSMKKSYFGDCPGKTMDFQAVLTNGAYGTTSAFTTVKASVEFGYGR